MLSRPGVGRNGGPTRSDVRLGDGQSHPDPGVADLLHAVGEFVREGALEELLEFGDVHGGRRGHDGGIVAGAPVRTPVRHPQPGRRPTVPSGSCRLSDGPGPGTGDTDKGEPVAEGETGAAQGWTDADHAAAADLAYRAGQVLRELQAGDLEGKALGAEGDQRSHRLLIGLLAERFPHDRVRSEEDDQAKELADSAGRVWIIDPLDGTREYSERRSDWAVHVLSLIHISEPTRQ